LEQLLGKRSFQLPEIFNLVRRQHQMQRLVLIGGGFTILHSQSTWQLLQQIEFQEELEKSKLSGRYLIKSA
jgi:hypothetical protein